MNKKLIISLSALAVIIAGFFVYKTVTAVKVQEVDLTEQQEKINEYANPDALVTPESLKAMMEDEKQDVVVVGTMKTADEAISGSYVVWRPDYSGTDAYPYDGMANSKEDMEKMLSDFGVKEDTTIVTYAANKHHDAARLYWQFKLLGHEDVRILDGGVNVWMGAGYETGSAAKIGDREATDYKAPNYNEEAFTASMDEVKTAVGNEDYILIDTRGEDEETGADTKSGAFGPGKIKDALWINYSDAATEETTFKSKAELEELYKDVLSSDKEVITYCQSGVRSAYTWFVLIELLGYDADVKNYDGSWIEWSYQAYEKDNQEIIDLTQNGDF